DGSVAYDVARLERPALILLDVDLPGLDGYAVCRKLKASPEMSATPVAFMTARREVDDRLTGLALGADDYLTKPIDPREMVLRAQLLLRRTKTTVVEDSAGLLTYEAFAHAAAELLRREPGSLALVRLPRTTQAEAIDRLVADARRRDLIGRYDAVHLVMWLPGVAPEAARDRLRT